MTRVALAIPQASASQTRQIKRDPGSSVDSRFAKNRDPLALAGSGVSKHEKVTCRAGVLPIGFVWVINGRKHMASDKAARDRANNQKFQDIYIHASQEPWLPFFPGIDFKVLRATKRQVIGPFF